MSQLGGPLVLVGCGKMGSALLSGWIAKGLPAEAAHVVEPSRELRGAIGHNVQSYASADELPGDLVARAIVFAVKPQVMAAVLPAYTELVARGGLVLSIAAGTTIATFARAFGASTAIVRAMPNTPAAVGRGASALIANDAVSGEQRSLAFALLAAVGDALWLDDEDLMHAVTAMSGGGPAYVFLLIEALAAAGVQGGLPADLAMRLARATVIGSGELAAHDTAPAAILRKNVTSPGGTTQAALGVLMAGDGIQPLFDKAIAAAAQRSRELG